ncbi:ATP-binding cassette domain-containing protein [Devosia sp.]|uniref:ABC transporter ATP-binding protein n=1 Tax=Devosia sp. TaxID=1871048 RepID=UPI003267ABEB
MSRELLVRVENLRKSYVANGNAYDALRHASGTVLAGDRVAVVGRTGSGKSTLLHLLAGLDAPSSGSISWPGLGPQRDLRPGKIGVVFQSPSLVPWLDVTENLILPLLLCNRPDNVSILAAAALDRFELGHLATRLPEELSGGQAQRVSMARATMTGPSLVLADEPTGQLDLETGTHLMDALFEWADHTGAALVVATHDPGIAARFTTKWQVDQGSLITPTELLS